MYISFLQFLSGFIQVPCLVLDSISFHVFFTPYFFFDLFQKKCKIDLNLSLSLSYRCTCGNKFINLSGVVSLKGSPGFCLKIHLANVLSKLIIYHFLFTGVVVQCFICLLLVLSLLIF